MTKHTVQINSDKLLTLEIFPENTLSKLEFDVIKLALLSNCISELGRRETELNTFLTDRNKIIKKLQEVKEFQDIIYQDKSFPVEHYHDLQDLLKMIELHDYTILSSDALHLYQFINSTELVISFFKKNKDQLPPLMTAAFDAR